VDNIHQERAIRILNINNKINYLRNNDIIFFEELVSIRMFVTSMLFKIKD